MRVVLGPEMTSSCGPLPRRVEAEFWKDPPAVKVVPSGQQDACGSCTPASWEGMNAKAATAVAQRRLEWRPHTIS